MTKDEHRRRQDHYVEVYKRNGGTEAAKLLGVSRQAVYEALWAVRDRDDG